MAKYRSSQHISNKADVDYLLSLTEQDLLKQSVVLDMFGEFNGKYKYRVYDTVDIPPGSYGPEGKKNKNTFTTTMGRYVYNKIFIEQDLFDIFKYINSPINKKMFKKINQTLAHGVMEEKIDLEVVKRYLMKTQKMMPLVTVLMKNESEAMYMLSDKLAPKKKELLKKYEKDIKAGHDDVVPQMEKELIEYAKTLIDDGSLDVYDNDESADYSNNFKNMFVMKGLIKKNNPGSKGSAYNTITGDYMTGIPRDEYVQFADSLAAGPYMRARKTATGGYWEKLFRIFEHVVLDEPGTDCHTKRTIEVELTGAMEDYVYYSYCVENGKLIELTEEEMKKRSGKKVQIRFSSLCENKNGKICNKCAGNKFYRLGVKNIGSMVPQIGSKIKNINMKAFHDSQVVFQDMDPMKAFFPFGAKGKQAMSEDVQIETIEQQLLHENNLLILNENVLK